MTRKVVSPAVFICVILTILHASGTVVAQDYTGSSGPYCGIYCAYGAIKLAGQDISFEKLLVPKYLNAPEGSSSVELKAALTDAGLNALILTGLSGENLRMSEIPMMLHIASEGQLDEYNHWVLYLGLEKGKAVVIDPPGKLARVAISEILARWDGSAVVTSKARLSPRSFWLDSVGGLLYIYVGVFALVVALSRSQTLECWTKRGCGRLLCFTALFLASMSIAIAFHFIHPDGFLRNLTQVSYVCSVNVHKYFPEVSVHEISERMNEGLCLVVDARLGYAYEQGHIPGAINVPVSINAERRREVMRSVDKKRPIIIYCQNSSCAWSNHLASALARDGFTEISIYPGGWQEWSENGGRARIQLKEGN